MFTDNSNVWLTTPQSTGTTTIAAEFNGGVIIGADSRSTTGPYVANRVADKLTKVSQHIYCCRSGSAADTQAIAAIATFHLSFLAMEQGYEPLVDTTAAIFKELCYNYRDSLIAGILVAGWDQRKGGQIYSIPIGGMCTRQPISIGGSGSSYIYGFVDSGYKIGMDREKCVDFVINALALAMTRDGSSGGIVRLGIITEEGIERRVILSENLPKFNEF